MAAWAMGAEGFHYPIEAGLPIGGADFNPYLRLEIHYNNPLKKAGKNQVTNLKHWRPRRSPFNLNFSSSPPPRSRLGGFEWNAILGNSKIPSQ